jgi:23S rRNA-/tRNA-specific pseudouridylate synthase
MSAPLRWVVSDRDGARLSDVLHQMREPAAADQGRAFVNGRRANPGEAIAVGDVVEVWAARDASVADAPRVLAQRRGLVLAYKPAGLPSEADRRGTTSMARWLERQLGARPHLASRLDVGVSGVVLAAVGEDARRHVAREQAHGRVTRCYVALAGGRVEGRGSWSGPVGPRRLEAETRFEAVAYARPARRGEAATTFLRLWPITGRTHQLRLHATQAGAPLLGCREHGGARTVTLASGAVVALDRVALHARAVALSDERGEPLDAGAELPDSLRAVWLALDGPADACDEVALP